MTSSKITESAIETFAIELLEQQGYQYIYGPSIALDSDTPECRSFEEVLLLDRLKASVTRINPTVPAHAREEVAAFGPVVGAFISLRTLKGKGSISRYLKSFLSLKFGWKVWVTIFLVLCFTTFAAWFIPELFGKPRLTMLLPSMYFFPVYWLIMVFLGGGQEEIGWRGYILPFLQKRYGIWTSLTLITGIVVLMLSNYNAGTSHKRGLGSSQH